MHVNPLDEIHIFETSCPQPTISAYPNFAKPRESQHTLFLQRDGKQREGLDRHTDKQTLHIETVQVQMGNHSCFCRFWPSHWHLLVFLLPLSFSVAKKEKKNNTTNSGAGGWQQKKKGLREQSHLRGINRQQILDPVDDYCRSLNGWSLQSTDNPLHTHTHSLSLSLSLSLCVCLTHSLQTHLSYIYHSYFHPQSANPATVLRGDLWPSKVCVNHNKTANKNLH